MFLQGVTVTEDRHRKEIVLIDGQQRTTFLYLLLKYLGYRGQFELRYDIRVESGMFIGALQSRCIVSENEADEYQDRYYFSKTLRMIREMLVDGAKGIADDEYENFMEYVLDNVRFLYIVIPESQAKKVFTMMNGSRAKMLPQEIIKAELLRLASRPDEEPESPHPAELYSREWELNMLRSRYAREWDRWIHWWNRSEVQTVFDTDKKQLGWFLMAAMPEKYRADVSFEDFCKEILGTDRDAQKAKQAFDRLRRVQKRFEDSFNDSIRYNKIGAILRVGNAEDFIKYYFGGAEISDAGLDRYYRCAFLGMSHKDITTADPAEFIKKARERYTTELRILKMAKIFEDDGAKERAYQLLLRLNIDEDNRQNKGRGRKFDFDIWRKGMRSLEHIYAKSKVYHLCSDGTYRRGDGKPGSPETDSPDCMYRSDIGFVPDPLPEPGEDGTVLQEAPMLEVTEHSIGNLVLLYNEDNKKFNARNFNGKKDLFLLGENKDDIFRSRHLLHTIYHFSEGEWGAEEIRKYFVQTLKDFHKTYKDIIDDAKQN